MKSRVAVLAAGSFSISLLITKTFSIAVAFTSVISALAWISVKRSQSKRSWELFIALPEIIDHMISGIRSGLSLNESLINLGERGPAVAQIYFQEFSVALKEGVSFEIAISHLQDEFSLRAADQLFESLVFAKSLGGSELLAMLRQLGDFTRQDLSLRREIAAKQGWVRNSAHPSAGAPWILPPLLSTQPSTSAAFSSPPGISILAIGVLMTSFAYLWMGKLSHIPEPQRIFGGCE